MLGFTKRLFMGLLGFGGFLTMKYVSLGDVMLELQLLI